MKLVSRLAAVALALYLTVAVAAHNTNPNASGYSAVNGAVCETYIDIVQMHSMGTQWLVNERTPMDGYDLYSSTFYPDYATAMVYVHRVQAEFITCDWEETSGTPER